MSNQDLGRSAASVGRASRTGDAYASFASHTRGVVRSAFVLLLLLVGSTAFAQSFTLTTTFTGGTTGGNGGNVFDITTNASPILITQFDCHMSTTTTQAVDIYYKTGTYSGSQTNIGAWTHHETVTTTGAGANNPTPLILTNPILLQPATIYGIAVVAQTTALRYNSITGPVNFTDANITLTVGAQVTTGFASSIANRQWNGTVHYTLGTAPLLLPATGSGFDSSLTYNAALGVPLSAATLVANDFNNANIDVTVSTSGAAPGVTAPGSQVGAAVPVNMAFTGTPTTVGTYTYNFLLSDGTNTPNFTVTLNVTNPGPTLDVPTGSGFNASYIYSNTLGSALANATLEANDVNTALIDVTITPVSPAPGVTAPVSQTGAAVPVTLTWSGTPASVGTYTYNVVLFDGTTTNNFTVTIETLAPTVTVGTQGTGNAFPFNYSNATGRFQTCYTATELGLTAGALITQVRVFGSYSATINPTYNNLRLRLAHSQVAVASLSGVYEDNYVGEMTTVLGPVNITPVATPVSATTAWWTFSFAQPFYFNGVDNLLVDWSYTERIGTGFTISTGTGRSRIYANGGDALVFGAVSSTTGGGYGIEFSYLNALDGVALSKVGGNGFGRVVGAQTDYVVWDARARALTTARNINSITFTKNGSLPDGDFTNLRLMLDGNDNGVVDGGDTQLGTGTLTGGAITFGGAFLHALTVGTPSRLLLAVTLPGSATAGGTFSFEIVSPAGFVTSGGADYTAYPCNARWNVIGTPVVVGNNWTQNFESAQPFQNMVPVLAPGNYPNATAVGATPTIVATTNNGICGVGAGPLAGSTPNAGSGMLHLWGNATGSASAMEFHLDLSGRATTDQVDLSFWYNDEGIDSSTTTDPYNFIFLSTNGGATWEAAVWDFPESGTEGVWNFVSFNLSPIMQTYALNYTGNMVLRFQIAETISSEHALFDDIMIDVPPPRLQVSASTAGPASVTTGLATDQWLGTYNAASINSNQQVTLVTLTQTGTVSSTGFSNLRLWVDTNANNQFDSAIDTPISAVVASMTGSAVTFTGLPAFTSGQSAVIFLTGQIASSMIPGTSRFELLSGSDISSTPGPVNATYPVQGALINVVNPAPTLTPATGSNFNASLVLIHEIGGVLTAADLVADDSNDPNVSITIVAVSPAPGVTQPADQASAAVPATISWTGNPSALGSYSYTVTVGDGLNAPSFNVTINVTNPAPTLTPATGSNFNASRILAAQTGVTLTAADLVANDSNDPNVNVTIVAVSPAPGVTQPADQTSAAVPTTISWTGTPTTVGSYTYTVTVSDGVSSPNFTVTIDVSNPAPTLTPATGSGFNASRVYAAQTNVALTAATLVANDVNDPTVTVTIVAVSAAPGVTQPADQTNVSVPTTIAWTGTPTATGAFTYTVTVNDGTNSTPFTVTIDVTNPVPTLAPAAGSSFNASRVYSGATGTALANAVLEAGDQNNPNVDVTIVAVNAAPGVTQPANLTGVAVPAALTWTGTPTAGGTFTYNVTVSDGSNAPTFVVTFNIQLAGTIPINQTTGPYTSLGAAFDAIETLGLGGPVILEFTDSATYTADASYTIGMNNTGTVIAISGLSATNSITIRAGAGQTPRIQGNATGAVLQTPLTGRGCLGIMSSFTSVEGIECFDGPNFGILIQGNNTTLRPINNAIRSCVVHDIPDGPGIAYMGQNSSYFENGVIENNFVWNCFTNSGNPTTSSVLLNNTGGSITVRNPHAGTGVVRHNTIVHTSTFTTTGGIYTYSSSTAAPMNDVNNNIIVCTDPNVPAFTSATSDTNLPTPANCNHNYWFAVTHCSRPTVATFALWQASGRDANGSNANPQLVSTTAPFDLHLAPTSPCIDPANQTSTLNIDIDGDARPLGPAVDIGADEAIVPFITLAQGATNIAPGGTINVGTVATTTGATFTFTIANGGGADLLLTGGTPVVTTIVNNLDVNSGVVTQPATTITPTNSVTFDILLDPTIGVGFTMTVSIANNDVDRDPYTFTIDGTGFTPNGDALANTAAGSSLSGGTNGPFTLALNPGVALANVEIVLTDPETDNITVNSISVVGATPTGITAPAIPGVGHPINLIWTGTADASNAPGPYTWEVEFQDAVSGNPVTVQVIITINNLAPQHAIANATGGDGSAATPYTAVYTETMDFNSDIDLATVTDANTGQALQVSLVTPIVFPPGGNGFAFDIIGGFLNVAPANVLAAGDVGTHTFDVSVTDGIATVTIRVSIVVSAAPSFVTVSPITDGEQGVAYSFTFVVTGGTGALTFSLAAGGLPNGLGLNANGMITGTPTLAGVYNFDVSITDALAVSDTGSFTLTIDPPANGNPTITTTSPLATGRQGDAYGPVTITATGGTPGYSFTVTAGTLPPGLTLSTAGVISGTATLQGTYAFTITATDAAFATDSDAFQIIIDAPAVTSGKGSGDGGGGGCVAGRSGAGLMAIFAILLALAICARLRPTRE